MAEYLDVPIETDPDALAEDAFDYISDQVPGWEPNAGNLEVWLIEALARMSAEVRDLASMVPETIFRYFGGSLLGIEPIEAAGASADTTWTVIDTIVATEEGTESSGLGGAGAAMELIDPLDFVNTVVLTSATAGGVDAETDATYLNRLADNLRLLTPRPIVPDDFATLARNIPGVERALAIDGYNPVGGTYNNERMVAVALQDASGNAVSTAIKTQVDAMLQAQREVNFVVNVIDATYTTFDVTFTAIAYPGWDLPAVEVAAESAVATYLSPSNWGRTTNRLFEAAGMTGDPGDTDTDDRSWVNETVMRYLELATVINNVEGINYVSALTFGISGQALGSVNVTLPGAAPLPRPGVINGSVS